MKNKKRIEIEITLNENTQIYNTFNNKQLSDKLSNYIYYQCKGAPTKSNINININHNFKMSDEEKIKIIDAIRSNYGIDIKENILTIKHEHIKELILLLLGSILLILSNILVNKNALLGEIISIFGCVIIWEIAYNIVFIETTTRIQNQRLERLKKAKIVFKEINQEN